MGSNMPHYRTYNTKALKALLLDGNIGLSDDETMLMGGCDIAAAILRGFACPLVVFASLVQEHSDQKPPKRCIAGSQILRAIIKFHRDEMINATEEEKNMFDCIELPTAEYKRLTLERLREVEEFHRQLEVEPMGNKFMAQQEYMKGFSRAGFN
ncbi:hypothetical protein CPB83DRAFT_865364 [Crepidotus variabilis]|uniref:Uncharacterized protein n=1 Tax=Crepidotus variabilis TaxID=179855 RepID=A0A9P6E355_9AGAR|nr:hypothetical protein CPB83DRAFT_911773 [Crepidotus variabilis]KAF9521648.1 hypothetical protein CPB83DRAFT_865364 [Crepidotus variabilis]